MERIAMQDLGALHAPLEEELRAAAARVIASGRFILGPEVAAFEGELAAAIGVAHVVGVSSGTDALLALLMAAGIGPGDEVVTTPYSFIATAEAIVRVGARPVFADVEPDTLNLDPRAAAARVGPRTRALLVVHLFGRPARLTAFRDLCLGAGVALYEDAAQAIGVDGVGSGDAAALSFFPAKNLGGLGDGGAVLTSNPTLAVTLRRLRNHGAADKMHHDVLGGNFRLDELQAALLRVKLPLLGRWTSERRRLAALYRDRLGPLPVVLPPDDPAAVWSQFVIRVPAERRPALRRLLDERGVATAVYYPLPLHLQPALAFLGHRPGDFPHAERASAESLALPIYPGLTDAAMARVAAALSDFFR